MKRKKLCNKNALTASLRELSKMAQPVMGNKITNARIASANLSIILETNPYPKQPNN